MTQMYVQPTKLISPYSGDAVMPQINNWVQDGKVYEQATWSDTRTGMFIKRGIVSIKDQKSGETIGDWQSGSYNSIKHTSYRG